LPEASITFGEIMLRLATPGYLRFSQARQFEATFGGGEANVAVSLANSWHKALQGCTRHHRHDQTDEHMNPFMTKSNIYSDILPYLT